MLSKTDLLDSMLDECDIAKHLATKMPEGGLEYRQSPTQRNTLELMRYISFCGIGGSRYLVEGNWDGYQEVAQRAAEMGPDEFADAMDRQKAELTALFEGIPDEDLTTKRVSDPMGNEDTLGRMLLRMPVRWMGGYRMQLFLNIKAAGNDEIWTPDCWMGVSMERPKPN